MTEQPGTEDAKRATRTGERRGNDRRAIDRRAPPPLWRRPWAYVAYGVAAGLALVLVFGGGRERLPPTGPLETTTALPGVDTVGLPSARKPVLEATSVGDYERLLAQGESAAGQRVRTVLYCSPMRSVSLIAGSSISPSMASLADARGQVPGAECQWGSGADAPDLFLLVPPALANDFAATREVEISFVRRRRVPAEIEWIGRSEALALRIVGVLQDVR
jgi:hypothetical protein